MDQVVTPLLIRCDPRLPSVWWKLSPYLERAIKESGCYRDWTIEDVFTLCAIGQCHLWALVIGDSYFGACVTQITQYPRRKVMDALLVGADDHTEGMWLQCFEQLKAIARSFGASSISGTGRDGWFRKLDADRRRYVIEVDI